MEGMERIASEQLAKLAISSETEEMNSVTISKIYLENRQKLKLKAAKELLNAPDLAIDEKAKQLYTLLTTQAESTKKLEIEAASLRKRSNNCQREKETMINEINNYREQKSKLEQICREIKKKNDEIIQQCKEIEESEKAKLEEINEKMTKTMQEITEKLEEHEGEKNKLMEENKQLISQMEELREQALSRDQEFQNIIMEKNLEVQLLKVQVEYKTGFEEQQLKSQVDLYKNRFSEFTSILEKSTEAYGIADVEVKKIDDKIAAEKKLYSEHKRIKDAFDIELIQLFNEKNSLNADIVKLKSHHAGLKQECAKLLEAKRKVG